MGLAPHLRPAWLPRVHHPAGVADDLHVAPDSPVREARVVSLPTALDTGNNAAG